MMDWWTDLVMSIRRYGIESVFRRYYSRYHAIVVDVDDPENRARILVKVPSLFGNQALANWAEPVVHGGQMSLLGALIGGKPSKTSGKFCGSFNPPKKDDWVFVEFLNGSANHPVYHPQGWFGDGDMPSVFDDASSWNMLNPIMISRYGHQIYLDESTGKAKFVVMMNNGNSFTIDESSGDQKIEIKTPSGSSWVLKTDDLGVGSDLEIDIKGGITEKYLKAATQKYSAGLSQDITGAHEVKVTGKSTQSYSLGLEVSVGANKKEDVSGNLEVTSAQTTFTAKGVATFKGSKQTLGSGGHPVPHGDILKTALEGFCDSLSKLTPGSPANNAQAIASIMQASIKLKTDILRMNSMKTETD